MVSTTLSRLVYGSNLYAIQVTACTQDSDIVGDTGLEHRGPKVASSKLEIVAYSRTVVLFSRSRFPRVTLTASIGYRHNPQWRLAQLDGAARTLRGSYRRSYARFSECVPGEMYNTIQSFSRPLRRSRLGSRATRCSLVGTVRNIKGKQRKVQKEAALQQERCSRVVSRRCK